MNDYKIICDEKTGICNLVSSEEIGYLDNIKKEIINVFLFTNPINEISKDYYIDLLKFYLQYSEYINFNLVIGNGNSNVYNSLLIKVFELAEQKNEIKALQFLNFARFYSNYLGKNLDEKNTIKEILQLINCKNSDINNLLNLNKANDLITSDINFAEMYKIKEYPSLVMINENNQGLKIKENHNFEKYQQVLKRLSIDKTSLIPIELPSFSNLIDNILLISQDEIEYLYGINISNFNAFIEEKLNEKKYEILEFKSKKFIMLNNN
ncbi:MAG TPA: hypothetical protein GX695_02230 [Acholeplasmataceae bacterium]|nr:hypothetical protein [Acholeplasmataceae bacterium]